ncbi:MAG: MmcQ/YjbR family DNA-binding protein [Rhizomicrobium sp.]
MTAKTKKPIAPGQRGRALTTFLAARDGATVSKIRPNVAIYKVTDRMFAIHSEKSGYVVLKCDPNLIDILKAKYAGVGHKTHLNPRHWIAVEIDSDVPAKEIERLADLSHDLVRVAKKPAARRARKTA